MFRGDSINEVILTFLEGLRNRSVNASQQGFKSRIGSQRFQPRIDAHEGEADSVLTFSLREPAKGAFLVTKPTIHDGDLVG